ncbi:MAG: hypothetical protein L3J66_02105 [Bacteroidales bacterium]|nr:hypothetical protein [Bacteroidales bacterium]
MNFLISIILFAVSVFLLAVSIRYGLRGAARLDAYFSQKHNSGYPGFEWYYRIPFSIGVIPEYFYALIMAYDNYFKRNWWALKTASFISVLVFISGLKSRSAVAAYFSFDFLKEGGITALFTSGNFVMFMNIIVLLYTGLFVLICIESFRMHGIYAPVRIAVYSILSLMMANLTVITLSIIVFVTLVYIVIKIIGFFFRSRRRRRYDREEEEETAGSILGKGLRDFKTELYQWEDDQKSRPKSDNKTERKTKTMKRKRPKIKVHRKDAYF